MRLRTTLITALGVGAMVFAPAALAEKPATTPGAVDGNPGQGGQNNRPDRPDRPDKSKRVGYVFKGTYGGDGSVAVAKGNRHVRKAGLIDTTVAFDLSEARVVVADTNGDGSSDLADVAAGDEVQVKAKLPKADPGAQPFAAKHLIDKTHPPVEEQEPASIQ